MRHGGGNNFLDKSLEGYCESVQGTLDFSPALSYPLCVFVCSSVVCVFTNVVV